MGNFIPIVIQARTGSTRLPNKMIIPFFDDKNLISILIERLIFCTGDPSKIILATTTLKEDDVFEKIVKKYGINIFRGENENVLKRFLQVGYEFNLTSLIRVCADNPFLSADFIIELNQIAENCREDYIAYFMKDGRPSIKTHYGFWAEYVKLDALKKIVDYTNDFTFHEHVTNFIYEKPQYFSIKKLEIPEYIQNSEGIRLTLDTKEDFELQQKIFKQLFPKIDTKSVIKYLISNPKKLSIMKRQIERNIK